MTKRENLNKLKVNDLRNLAVDVGIDVKRKKKEEIIQELLLSQTETSILTPIVEKDALESPLVGSFQDSLPPFNVVAYESPGYSSIPTITFSDIYSYMIERPTTYGGTASNFKGLDRSVKHFEAGDVQDIKVSKVIFFK